MGAWMIDLMLLGAAVLLMGYALYQWMFSATEFAAREQDRRKRPVFERREAERVDRRKQQLPLASGIERRRGPRR